MQEISVVFPNQLFQKHPALAKGREVWLVEEHLFFNQYAFHKKKLVFHRASMQYYADFLRKKGYTVHITEAGEEADIRLLVKKWNGKVSAIHIADVVDDWLDRRLTKAGEMNNIRLIRYASPGFLNEDPWQDGLLKNNRYYQADFYIGQRTGRQILLDGEGKPEGGKWSFDTENRKRLPKTQAVPVLAMPYNNHYLPEAIKYIKKHSTITTALLTDCLVMPTDFIRLRMPKRRLGWIIFSNIVLLYSAITKMRLTAGTPYGFIRCYLHC